jgi:peptidoglycan LD-endopeptidase LytH
MRTVTKTPRFLPAALVMTVLFLCAALLLPAPFTPTASAGPLADARGELAKARDAMGVLQDKLDALAGTYQDAVQRKEEIDAAVAKLEKDETRSQTDLAKMQKQLAERLVSVYKNNTGNGKTAMVLEILFQETDLVRVLERIQMLGKVASQDDDFYQQITQHLANVDRQQTDLSTKRAQQAKLVTQLNGAQGDLETQLQNVSAEYKQLKQRVATLEEEARLAAEAEKARNAAMAARTTGQAQPVKGFVFPIDGAHSFRDDYGDYRSAGGSHQGIDIYAARGTDLVAVVSGTVVITPYDSISGTKVWIYGDNGTHYFYCHLDGIADGISGGVHVRAGQLVGYVGNSGNATGGPCHLHFEMHPGGGGAVNPYYVLRAAD